MSGPIPARPADIPRINRLFSDAFTDRYHRDGMSGVRVPELNPAIWRFAIADAGDGAMLWRDAGGEIAAFNLVHRSGEEGWMGPLAVRPDRQGEGLGSTIVRTGIERLRAAGARIIGLETMPRTVDNIGFYSRLGFRPGHLTVSMTRELAPPEGTPAAAPDAGALLAACRGLTERLGSGADFSGEIRLTREHGLGDVTVLRDGDEPAAFALWHSAPLAEGRGADEARVLKLVARDLDAFRRVVRAVEADVWRRRSRRLSIRCQTAFRPAYGALLDLGYEVHWTDLRMTLDGSAEPEARGEAVVFSNWEI